MTLSEFKSSLRVPVPPKGVNNFLHALWYEANGKWDEAHNIVQGIETNDSSWIHAYLHRKEGDDSNALYWYNRAGRKFPKINLEKEWEDIVSYFLDRSY